MKRLWLWSLFLGVFVVASGAWADDIVKNEQSVLGPGLYLFQTRVKSATCGDADRTGYVHSQVATIDGIPGARKMTMKLPNSKYWPTWDIVVEADGAVGGTALTKDKSAVSAFEVRKKKGRRFVGKGMRQYNRRIKGKKERCSVEYEALLKRID